jgi:hypothetical protein
MTDPYPYDLEEGDYDVEEYEFDEAWLKPFLYERQDDIVWEYFRITIPSDVWDESQPDYRARMDDTAILNVRESATTWRIPANWWVDRWEGDDAIVVRLSSIHGERHA